MEKRLKVDLIFFFFAKLLIKDFEIVMSPK